MLRKIVYPQIFSGNRYRDLHGPLAANAGYADRAGHACGAAWSAAALPHPDFEVAPAGGRAGEAETAEIVAPGNLLAKALIRCMIMDHGEGAGA